MGVGSQGRKGNWVKSVFKSIISLIIILLLIIFSTQNMSHTSVHVIMGGPIQLPLILIIAVAFIAGYATALLAFVVTASRKKKKEKSELPGQYNR